MFFLLGKKETKTQGEMRNPSIFSLALRGFEREKKRIWRFGLNSFVSFLFQERKEKKYYFLANYHLKP